MARSPDAPAAIVTWLAKKMAALSVLRLVAMSTVYNAALKREASTSKKRGHGDVADNAEAKVRRNKQRVLVLPSRGVTTRMRHLVNDVEALLPHSKKGACLSTDTQTPSWTASQICLY